MTNQPIEQRFEAPVVANPSTDLVLCNEALDLMRNSSQLSGTIPDNTERDENEPDTFAVNI
ncbi:MAG: hypothetical protein K2Z81_15580 [Cyanobacteria bacterium]|nr:hypothetical protein [Cyanobacteriota bacterium]